MAKDSIRNVIRRLRFDNNEMTDMRRVEAAAIDTDIHRAAFRGLYFFSNILNIEYVR